MSQCFFTQIKVGRYQASEHYDTEHRDLLEINLLKKSDTKIILGPQHMDFET